MIKMIQKQLFISPTQTQYLKMSNEALIKINKDLNRLEEEIPNKIIIKQNKIEPETGTEYEIISFVNAKNKFATSALLNINNKSTESLIDTGAKGSFISEEFSKKLNLKIDPLNETKIWPTELP